MNVKRIEGRENNPETSSTAKVGEYAPIVFNWSYFLHQTKIGLKNSSSISLLVFISLSFSSISFRSIKSFSNYKRLFLTFKNWFFRIAFKYFLSVVLFL